ncbi:hypothetical protein BOO71_0006253 [Deinococcus marmoris]|uniref:Uncharacterized protein n=1 Tax=Deinococcus marmoris TaxID=249408 RepID=A0A1U7NZP6_9DEIO|nr:hypothetical protein BOO71_0006253 [Deinococcus marmoris]
MPQTTPHFRHTADNGGIRMTLPLFPPPELFLGQAAPRVDATPDCVDPTTGAE